ncbi:MAG: hypothetical protein Q9219_003697 [cf. Caloplaca sp. 3 TL-2023]
MTSTKISGLAVDTEYIFHLVLRTSAGLYSSEKLSVRTHKMTDLSGITVTPGIMAPALRESLSGAVDRIGAKIAENVRIDTTHFVCMEGRGREWEKAVESNIPVVRPEWVEGCEREGRVVGVRGYYLNADPKLRQVGQSVGLQSPPRQQQKGDQPASSTAPISTTQLPSRAPLGASSNISMKDSRVLNPPPPSSPSEGGSPAPPPPAKDTPREIPNSQASPSESTASMPVSRDQETTPSQDLSTDRVDGTSFRMPKPAPQENGGRLPKREDSASMVDVAL